MTIRIFIGCFLALCANLGKAGEDPFQATTIHFQALSHPFNQPQALGTAQNLAITQTGKVLFLDLEDQNKIRMIDPETMHEEIVLKSLDKIHSFSLLQDRFLLFVSHNPSRLGIFDLAVGKMFKSLNFTDLANISLVVSPDQSRILIGGSDCIEPLLYDAEALLTESKADTRRLKEFASLHKFFKFNTRDEIPKWISPHMRFLDARTIVVIGYGAVISLREDAEQWSVLAFNKIEETYQLVDISAPNSRTFVAAFHRPYLNGAGGQVRGLLQFYRLTSNDKLELEKVRDLPDTHGQPPRINRISHSPDGKNLLVFFQRAPVVHFSGKGSHQLIFSEGEEKIINDNAALRHSLALFWYADSRGYISLTSGWGRERPQAWLTHHFLKSAPTSNIVRALYKRQIGDLSQPILAPSAKRIKANKELYERIKQEDGVEG